MQRLDTSDGSDSSMAEMRRYGPFESGFNASKKRPPMTYCYNNKRLAYVDGHGNMYITLLTDKNIRILQQNNYTPTDWGVPLSNGSHPKFDEWLVNEMAMERDAQVRAMPLPDVPSSGSFVIGNAVPGTYVLSADKSNIFWCSGKAGTEIVVTPNTAENIRELQVVGYTEGGWPPADISNMTSDMRHQIQQRLSAA